MQELTVVCVYMGNCAPILFLTFFELQFRKSDRGVFYTLTSIDKYVMHNSYEITFKLE